jgi:hypothetical protein
MGAVPESLPRWSVRLGQNGSASHSKNTDDFSTLDLRVRKLWTVACFALATFGNCLTKRSMERPADSNVLELRTSPLVGVIRHVPSSRVV